MERIKVLFKLFWLHVCEKLENNYNSAEKSHIILTLVFIEDHIMDMPSIFNWQVILF